MECAEDATKNSRARVPATAKPLCKANNSAPQRKNVSPSQDLWAWVYVHMYFSSHPRLVPKRSVRSHGSVIGGLDLWPAGQRAAASSGVIQTKARFAAIHVSAVCGSKGCMSANPQTSEFPQRRAELPGTGRHSNLHSTRRPTGAPILVHPRPYVLANCVVNDSRARDSI
jgi:hypothetical protein